MTKTPKKFDNFPAIRTKLWPIDKIKPYPRNPRTHPPAQIALLAAIFLKHGIDQPIVVDERGVILKGHGRREAAIKAGLVSYPVVQREGLTEAEKIGMRIEDNQLALLSGWDNELVRGEIGFLEKSGFDLALLGFGEAQLVSFQTTPGPPDAFGTFDESIPTAHECPRCGYKWSGKSAPAEEPPPPPAKKKNGRAGKAA